MEEIATFSDKPHKRYNPLTDEWILVSPHRTDRPWEGKEESTQEEKKPEYKEDCYLCPGNERAHGDINPEYETDFVFTNDFASLLPDTQEETFEEKGLFKSKTVQGTCEVICFTPKHNLTLAEMGHEDIFQVVNLWERRTKELGQQFNWIQIFENKGAIMGCSNPHPHGQIWAIDDLPQEALKEKKTQKKYFEKNNSQMLIDYAEIESKKESRTIAENDEWIILIPYWAVWPFETLVLPKNQIGRLTQLSQKQKSSLATALKELLVRYDNLFKTSFPYTMGWHQTPFNMKNNEYWTLHGHFYPPLLRSADVKKFMVGYEMLSEPGRDLTPEEAAEKLNELSTIHYKQHKGE